MAIKRTIDPEEELARFKTPEGKWRVGLARPRRQAASEPTIEDLQRQITALQRDVDELRRAKGDSNG